ncbi:MAG: LCP family protein [Clostridia bacterium]|nr:LCP family protein [Clostridia bacterium]
MKKLKWWGIALIVIGVLLLAYFGYYLYGVFVDQSSLFEPPAPTPEPTPTATAEPSPSGTPNPEAPPTATPSPTLTPEEALKQQADLEFMKNKVNILMLGWDESPERTEDEDSALYRDENNNFRSDVMILLTVDFEAKTAKLISIPRDTMAPIYNTEGRWKINAAFAKGGSADGQGFEYAMKTVENLLGVPIYYYAGVDMSGVKAVVDAMGGVDYEVDCTIKLNGRVLEPGFQHLNGQQVLDYCRARKGIVGGVNSDIGRADRQQRMLFAIFEQLKSRDQLANLPNIYQSVEGYIDTNLSLQQIAALSVFALNLESENLTRATLEGEYVNKTAYNGASFYVLHMDKLKELVKETFGIDIEPDMRYDISYVQGDKAARDALAYSTAANYLITNYYTVEPMQVLPFEKQQTANTLTEAALALTTLCQRGEGEEEQMRALDAEAIFAAQTVLREELVAACIQLGFCKADFTAKETRDLLPKDVVEALPEEPIVAVIGGQEPFFGGTFQPFNPGTGFGAVDPEAMD